ncbi:RlpA-like double-psi beta-barrel-protein domain-containing protein-containing protein [Trametes polyzona]|nr:RlpA-like double-psi beta-barrel-protein domain-containing protein-containing protein [Trametes polyzona]
MRFSTILVAVLSAASVSLAKALSGTGDATFYSAGLGACGITNSDADFIAAMDAHTFDTFPGAGANPNLNPICHKKLAVTAPNGKKVSVLVTDRCTGCAKGSIDLTPTAFQKLAPLSVGRLHGVKWTLQ